MSQSHHSEITPIYKIVVTNNGILLEETLFYNELMVETSNSLFIGYHFLITKCRTGFQGYFLIVILYLP